MIQVGERGEQPHGGQAMARSPLNRNKFKFLPEASDQCTRLTWFGRLTPTDW